MHNMTEEQVVDELAAIFGIDPDYYDIFGQRHVIGHGTKRAILAAMRVRTTTHEHLLEELATAREAIWRSPCDPVLVRRMGTAGTWSFRMPADEGEHQTVRIAWSIHDESGHAVCTGHAGPPLPPAGGEVLDGRQYRSFNLPLPMGMDAGYYDLTAEGVSPSQRVCGSLRLIIVPAHCYRPASLAEGRRLWGVSLQLYALRSRRNWGVGDFTDLAEWTEWTSTELGAGIIGLNPLHALKNTQPYHISPYSPDSRLYLNPLYIDVEDVSEFECSAIARRMMREEPFTTTFELVKKSDTVEYERVAGLKRRVLEALFDTFEAEHFENEVQKNRLVACTDRGRAFERYLEREGERLESYALFQALYETFAKQSPPLQVWQQWPEAYRTPGSAACVEFLATHRRLVRFHQYVQWLAHEQLRRAHERTHELGMPIGLYHDLALGSDRGGSDAWLFQSVLALGADCGCPPDAFAPEGQNWGLPPVNPHALRQSGYRMFVELLRKNLQYGGAIRLDHVMSLFRLFWIPRGLPPSSGAYVQYPWEDLLGILALESLRHRAVVVGEDLGTVPDMVRDNLGAAGVLSYRVFYFERHPDGEWKQPDLYPGQALAVVATHDLPTLAGFWTGEDLKVRERLGFYRDEAAYRRARDEREREKAGIARALRHGGVWPSDLDEETALQQPLSPEIAAAVHTFVARSPSSFMLMTIEDLVGDSTQVNLPGTLDSYPNWSHKTPFTLDELRTNVGASHLAMAVKAARA